MCVCVCMGKRRSTSSSPTPSYVTIFSSVRFVYFGTSANIAEGNVFYGNGTQVQNSPRSVCPAPPVNRVRGRNYVNAICRQNAKTAEWPRNIVVPLSSHRRTVPVVRGPFSSPYSVEKRKFSTFPSLFYT